MFSETELTKIQKGIEVISQFILDFIEFIEFLSQKINELTKRLSNK